MDHNRNSRHSSNAAFSMVELMVATVVMVVILLISATLIDGAQKAWRRSNSTLSQYREARVAFEAIGFRLAQARLNSYWDYIYEDNLPVRYQRESELHFLSGNANEILGDGSAGPRPGHAVFFQAPLGVSGDARFQTLESLLNAWGFFVEFGSDEAWQPSFVKDSGRVPPRYRFRLMQLRQPTEDLDIYDSLDPVDRLWITANMNSENLQVVAENIIGFIVSPLGPGDDPTAIAPDYEFDSRMPFDLLTDKGTRSVLHELPPVVKVTIIAISEETANRLQGDKTTPPEELLIEKIAAFDDARKYADDIDAIRQHYNDQRIEIRIFSASVPLQSAK